MKKKNILFLFFISLFCFHNLFSMEEPNEGPSKQAHADLANCYVKINNNTNYDIVVKYRLLNDVRAIFRVVPAESNLILTKFNNLGGSKDHITFFTYGAVYGLMSPFSIEIELNKLREAITSKLEPVEEAKSKNRFLSINVDLSEEIVGKEIPQGVWGSISDTLKGYSPVEFQFKVPEKLTGFVSTIYENLPGAPKIVDQMTTALQSFNFNIKFEDVTPLTLEGQPQTEFPSVKKAILRQLEVAPRYILSIPKDSNQFVINQVYTELMNQWSDEGLKQIWGINLDDLNDDQLNYIKSVRNLIEQAIIFLKKFEV